MQYSEIRFVDSFKGKFVPVNEFEPRTVQPIAEMVKRICENINTEL